MYQRYQGHRGYQWYPGYNGYQGSLYGRTYDRASYGNQGSLYGRTYDRTSYGNQGSLYRRTSDRASYGNQGFLYGRNYDREVVVAHQGISHGNHKWKTVRGVVVSYITPNEVFRGGEILEVSVVDASIHNKVSTLLGREKIQLQPGQQFPIPFQFQYHKPLSSKGVFHHLKMQARITDGSGQIMYINNVHTPVKRNVKVAVKPTQTEYNFFQ